MNNYRNFNSSVERDADVIYINRLNHSRVVSDFIREINDGIRKGYDNFQVDFSKIDAAFPNAVVPIAGIIEYLSKEKGITFEFVGTPQILVHNHILKPTQLDDKSRNFHIFNTVWKFTSSDEVYTIVRSFIDELSRNDRFYKGLLETVEWALYEVMDNVIQHSATTHGYIMGQLHTTRKYLAFTIFDSGQGIYRSLRSSSTHVPRNDIDAITLAIKEEVTRDKSIGQGNGLYGLHSIIKQGMGRLVITSGRGSYMYESGQTKTFSSIPWFSFAPGTIIDFQLDYSKDLSLDKALVFRGKQYEIVNIKVENLEDESGCLIYKIKDFAEGTGTRESAIRVKNEIFNILQTNPKKIIIDFKDVAVISSSFADELIAKLLLELGIFQFNNIIGIRGLDRSQQMILQRSVIQRLIEDFKS